MSICPPCPGLADLHNDPVALDYDLFTELDVARKTRVMAVTSTANFDEFDGARKIPGAPECGQHGEKILLELGHEWERSVALKDNGGIT